MIDWEHIDTVLLDMDGTLLDLHFDNYFWTQHLPGVYARENRLSENISIDELQGKLNIEQGTGQCAGQVLFTHPGMAHPGE